MSVARNESQNEFKQGYVHPQQADLSKVRIPLHHLLQFCPRFHAYTYPVFSWTHLHRHLPPEIPAKRQGKHFSLLQRNFAEIPREERGEGGGRGSSFATMRPGGNTTTEFFACRSESHNFICNCGTRVRFESIRKLADGEATERALEKD